MWTDCVRILESLSVYYAYRCKSLDKYLSINTNGISSMLFFSPCLTPHAVPLKPIVTTLGLHYQRLQLKSDTLYFRRVFSLN